MVLSFEINPALYRKHCHQSSEKTPRGIAEYARQLFKWVQAILSLGCWQRRENTLKKIRKFNSAAKIQDSLHLQEYIKCETS